MQSSALFRPYTFISFATLFNEVGDELDDTYLTVVLFTHCTLAVSLNFGIIKKYTISSLAREVKIENWVLLLYSVVRKLAFIFQDDEVYLFFWHAPFFLLSLRTPFLSYFKTECS